jgi:hypothetical protein
VGYRDFPFRHVQDAMDPTSLLVTEGRFILSASLQLKKKCTTVGLLEYTFSNAYFYVFRTPLAFMSVADTNLLFQNQSQ